MSYTTKITMPNTMGRYIFFYICIYNICKIQSIGFHELYFIWVLTELTDDIR